MKRRLADQGHRCHRTYLCPNTTLGLPRHPSRLPGVLPEMMGGLEASQPALTHPHSNAPQMSHPLTAAPPLLSPPKRAWDGSHGGSGYQGRRREGWKEAGGRWQESGGRAWGFIWSQGRLGGDARQAAGLVQGCLCRWRCGWAGHVPQPRGPLHTAHSAHSSCCRKARSPRCHSLGLSR